MFNIKSKIIVWSLVAMAHIAKGETVLVPSDSVKVFSCETNEALIFTGGYLTYSSLTVDGVPRNASFALAMEGANKPATAANPIIFPGPIEFTLFPGVFNVRKITNSQYKNIIVNPFQSTNIINVASNQTIRFLSDYQPGYCINAKFEYETNSVTTSSLIIYQYKEYDGPIMITLASTCSITNYICDETNNPNCTTNAFLASIQFQYLAYELYDKPCSGQEGQLLTIDVEKSETMSTNDWHLTKKFTILANSDHEFFRLKISPYNGCGYSSGYGGFMLNSGNSGSSATSGGTITATPPPLPWSNP